MEECKIMSNIFQNNELFCSLCDNVLSIPPIYNLSNIGKICGRCTSKAKEICEDENQFSRQIIYESVAHCIIFPCSNNQFGCDIKLNWGEVENHESICKFKKSNCPFSYEDFVDKTLKCSWKGSSSQLVDHVEVSHKNCLLNPPIINFSQLNTNSVFFTKVGTQLVAIVIKYICPGKLFCLLMLNGSNDESNCYRYQLKLYDEDNKENSVILRRNRLNVLDNATELFYKHEQMLEVDLDNLQYFLKQKNSVIGRFGVVKKNKKEITKITSPDNENTVNVKDLLVDEDMLQDLECSICIDYMIPPIFICQAGHSVCAECKKKIAICPTCKSPMNGTRNFALEKFTTHVKYPCHNREVGCFFVTTSDKIRLHELNCELSEKKCILKCPWTGLHADMVDHLHDKHSRYLIFENELQMHDLHSDTLIFYFVIVFEAQMFLLGIKHLEDNSIIFNMQNFGVGDERVKFYYQFQLVNSLDPQICLTLSNLCKSPPELPPDGFRNAVVVSRNMMEPFIFQNQYIYFRVKVIKK